MIDRKLNFNLVKGADALTFTMPIRHSVFVIEQGVPESIELDEFENECTHTWLEIDDVIVATARLRPYNQGYKLERMAVLPEFRKQGVGRILCQQILELPFLKDTQIILHSQEHALGFYRKLEFQVLGDRFFEADIPHFKMIRQL
jgi:predicted GNAT family N-acyltransferase